MSEEKAYGVEARLNAAMARLSTLETTVAGLPGGVALSMGSMVDTASMSNGWGKGGGWFKYQRVTLGSFNFVYLTAKLLTPGTLADATVVMGTGISQQPASAVRFPVWTDATKDNLGSKEGAAFELKPDGTFTCFGIYSAATRVDLNVLLPLDY